MLVGAAGAVSSLTGVNLCPLISKVFNNSFCDEFDTIQFSRSSHQRISSFLESSWTHTSAIYTLPFLLITFTLFIIMIVLVWFFIRILTINEIGSIGGLYDSVLALPAAVEGNYRGSYLTMTSKESLFFGIIYIVWASRIFSSKIWLSRWRTNFGIVMGISFWQKASRLLKVWTGWMIL